MGYIIGMITKEQFKKLVEVNPSVKFTLCENGTVDVELDGYNGFNFETIAQIKSYLDTVEFYQTSASRGGWTGD